MLRSVASLQLSATCANPLLRTITYRKSLIAGVHWRLNASCVQACMYMYVPPRMYVCHSAYYCRYLLQQVKFAVQSKPSIFIPTGASSSLDASTHSEVGNLYSLKPDVTFHFCTSQTPCKCTHAYVCLKLETAQESASTSHSWHTSPYPVHARVV